jgi:proton glutamate symport protein
LIRSLTFWIFVGMIAGVALGLFAPGFAATTAVSLVATAFLRLIRSIVAPLIFSTLVAGIAGAGSVRAMGRIGLKALVYFEVVTTMALLIGLAAVNIVRPGEGMHLTRSASEMNLPAAQATMTTLVEHTVPASVVDAMAKGEVLQIVVFAFLFGAACAAIGAKAKPVVDLCGALAEIMFRYTNYVMYVAPVGAAAAIAYAVGGRGAVVLWSLAKLILTLYGALVVFVVVVLGAVLLVARIPVGRFVAAVREPFLIAFSTATSEAALPRALENMEAFGVPRHIVALVIPAGYSFNLDGSTLYLSLAALFVAQAAGMHLALSQQLLMLLTLMLTSKGVAGVPRAALVILSGTLATFGLPLEGVAVLLGVDTLMDMVRTSVNVLGNCLASAVVARWEGTSFERTPGALTSPEPVR